MCWKCDHPGATTEDYLAELRHTMLEHGWAVQYVESERRPFAYTIGLTRYCLPELVVTGVRPRRAVRLLNTLAQWAVEGDRPIPGRVVELPDGRSVEMVAVKHPDVHLVFACTMFGGELSALQAVWADARGRWPWSPAFDDGRGTQPVLGVRGSP